MNSRKVSRSSESGQVLALSALLLLGLLAMMALVLDGGAMLLHRRYAQNAADAAALAGAYSLSLGADDAGVWAKVQEYAMTRNGADSCEAFYLPSRAVVGSGAQPAGSNGVRVRTTCISPSTFAALLGFEEFPVAAAAAAEATPGRCGGYAIWADTPTCNEALHWGGSGSSVVGRVHSNRDIYVGGSGDSIVGGTEHVTGITNAGTGNTFDPPPVQVGVAPLPIEFDIEDYRPGGRAAVEAGSDYHHIIGDFNADGSSPSLYGLYYVTGSVAMQGVSGGTFTIVAERNIVVQAGFAYQPYIDGLLFFSNMDSMGCTGGPIIDISGSSGTWGGLIYGPRGKIHYSASAGAALNGGIIGWMVSLTGSGATIAYDDTLDCGGKPRVRLIE